MSAPHSQPCDADECPCWLSGRDSMRLELLERHTDIIEAMRALVEMLAESQDAQSGSTEGVSDGR